MIEDWMTLLAGGRRIAADMGKGLELRLLSAMEVLEARREARGMARAGRERALCSNACLLARALERGGEQVFETGEETLNGLSVEEIASLARQWAEFNRRENPSPREGKRAEVLKKSLEQTPYARLQWRVLRTFGALPTETRTREMTDRDFLWCALNLMLDDEETLNSLCPTCRAEAEEGRCPACGAPTGGDAAGENDGFDRARFEQLRRGERA